MSLLVHTTLCPTCAWTRVGAKPRLCITTLTVAPFGAPTRAVLARDPEPQPAASNARTTRAFARLTRGILDRDSRGVCERPGVRAAGAGSVGGPLAQGRLDGLSEARRDVGPEGARIGGLVLQV